MDHNYTKKPIDIENNDQHFMSGESEVEEIISEDREGSRPWEGPDQKTFLIMQKGASHKEN